MIELRDVSLTYPGAMRPALRGVSITVQQGERLAVLGPNGSGKSTLARLCNGLLLPDKGAVVVDGMDTADEALIWDVRARVGFVQQNPENQIVGTVAEEDVAFGPENLGVPPEEIRRRVDGALAAVDLAGLARREPHMLSEGQKQRLAIAGALALDPAHLVLDEPTAMLDSVGRSDVLRAVRGLSERGVGVVHITHHLEDVLDSDRAIVLDAGRVVFEGSPLELVGDPDLSASLGIDVPPFALMTAALRGAGVPLGPGVMTAEEVVKVLWR